MCECKHTGHGHDLYAYRLAASARTWPSNIWSIHQLSLRVLSISRGDITQAIFAGEYASQPANIQTSRINEGLQEYRQGHDSRSEQHNLQLTGFHRKHQLCA